MFKWFRSLFKHKEEWGVSKFPHWIIRNGKWYWYIPKQLTVMVKRDSKGRFKR